MSASQKTYTPKELAESLGVTGKILRNYLRANHTRPTEAKNTSWIIDAKTANAARAHFAKSRAKNDAPDES
jgi:predicted site-specific integrase-resolvase